MIFLPIGRDESEIRRHAWISYGIIGVNIVLFVLLNLIGESRTDYDAIEKQWDEMVRVLVRNPHLEIPEVLDGMLNPAFLAQLEAVRAAAPVVPQVESEVRRQQSELDEMAATLVGLVRDTPVLRWAYDPENPSFARLVSSMFVHADFFHLFGNLLLFFITGPFVEDVFGRPIFIALYLFGGMIATWTHVAQSGNPAPLLGASGAIAAIMGAYLIRFHRSRLEFLFVPFVIRPAFHFRFFVPAFIVLPLWFGKEFYFATQAAEDAGVAFWSHVGGFVFGALVGAGMKVTRIEEKYIHPVIEGQISWKCSEELETAQEARQRMDWEAAKQELNALLSREPDQLDGLRLACEIAVEAEDWAWLGERAPRLIELYARQGENELARELIDEVMRWIRHLPDSFCGRAAAVAERSGDRRTAIELHDELARRDTAGASSLKALLQSARLRLDSNDWRGAREMLDRARVHPSCDGGWLEALELQSSRLQKAVPAMSQGDR